jgi:glutathione S-transferase
MSLAIGAGEKTREIVYERMVRPPEKYHEPWVTRCRAQMHGALGEIEKSCQQRTGEQWLVDDRLTQADITVTCICTMLSESVDAFGSKHPYPALRALVSRCEALPEFRDTYSKWFAADVQRPPAAAPRPQ